MTTNITVSLSDDDNNTLNQIMTELNLGKSRAMRLIFDKAKQGSNITIRQKDKEIILLKELVKAYEDKEETSISFIRSQIRELYKSEIQPNISQE